MKGPRRGFDRVPSKAWDHFHEIGPWAYATLAALANHADGHGECYPSTRRLAKMLGCSRRQIRRCLRRLEGCGLVTIMRRSSKCSVYHLAGLTPDQSVRPHDQTPDHSVRPLDQSPRTSQSSPPDSTVLPPRTSQSPKLNLSEPDLSQLEKKPITPRTTKSGERPRRSVPNTPGLDDERLQAYRQRDEEARRAAGGDR